MDKLLEFYAPFQTRGLKCDGCNLGKDYYSNGYRCFNSGLFFHETCINSTPRISTLYHPQHSLHFKVVAANRVIYKECKLCRNNLPKMYYYCSICDFAIDLVCAKKEVMVAIEGSKIHKHRLSLVPEMIKFTCHLCGLLDDRFPYVCNLCDLSFHKECAESTPELNYSCHPKHPLKLLTRVPSYTNGRCCLCRNILQNVFYHCSICNFSVDANCAKNPPLFTLDNPKTHEHPLILMPQRIFVCNACGMEDDDSNPYVCSQCNFMIHRNCIEIPRIIKIKRHVHRIRYNHCLNPGDWKCGLCHKEIKWTCGAYSCLDCPRFAVHLRCATSFKFWDGIELEGTPENTIEANSSYEVIGEGIIKHFSHENHALKLKDNSGGDDNDEGILCEACTYPVLSSPFYSCMECNEFILHQKCAYLPKKTIDYFYNMHVTLIPSTVVFPFMVCGVCQNLFKGFAYVSDNNEINLDVRCGSISEPFVHESHPAHPLYLDYSSRNSFCNACGEEASMVLRCEEEECEFLLDIKCSILPKMVKHKYDQDHLLSLCYGKKTNEVYWGEICEEELDPKKWFYSCDHCNITLHIKCTLGDFIWIKPEDKVEASLCVIPNNRITRPICALCDSRCIFPSLLRSQGVIVCSLQCIKKTAVEVS